jgi:hypothetical protein
MKRHVTAAVGVGLLVLLAFGSVPNSGGSSGSKRSKDDDDKPKRSSERVGVSAADLYKDYKANEVSADDKYKGKTLKMSGTITSINKGIGDSMYLVYSTSNQFEGVQAHLAASQKSKAAGLSKGASVTVECIGDGMIIGSPMLKDCTIE